MTWETVPLGRLASLNPRSDSNIEPGTFLGMADVSENGTTSTGIRVEPRDLKSGYTPFRDRDILVAKITPCFENGKIAQATLPTKLGWGSTEFHVVRPHADALHDRYALHYLRTSLVRANGTLRMTGSAGQRRVPVSFLQSLEMPLPPLPEQRRIAAILDEADAVRSTAMRLTRASASISESAFRELEMTLSGRDVVPLSEIATVGSGITKGRKAPPAGLVEVPYMTVANVQDKRLDLSNVKTIEASEAEIERYRLLTNDLLLTEGGDPDKLGRGVVWNSELPVSIHQNHVFRVRRIDPSIDMTWLSWEIGSDYGKRYFLRAAKQTTGIATINSSQLRSFPVRVPSKVAIAAFRERLDRSEALEATSARRVDAFATLFASLQHRAFRGEL
ncbi:restriction endonuclease subunit S [Microbacterium sp. CCNWLW134]|uniref:restriction endonuclease subunit S n=1 Tax=Microbacterium sp. CCNWLW134 TaxID=3122064 RepID=UPI00300F98F9